MTTTFTRSYSAAPAAYGGRYRDYWRGGNDASERSQSRGRSQWRTFNRDWDTWDKKGYYYSYYGSSDRSPSRDRYGSWSRYYDKTDDDWYSYKDYSNEGYWVGNWWYCGDGDWYWSRDTGYIKWKKEEEQEERDYYDDDYNKTSDYWEYTAETPKNDWTGEQWAALEDRQGTWWNSEDWNKGYYYDYGKSGENSDGHWDGRVDYGWHLSSKFPRAPKTLDEHYEPHEDVGTPGNPYIPLRDSAEVSWTKPSLSPPSAEPSMQEQHPIAVAEETVWRLTCGGRWWWRSPHSIAYRYCSGGRGDWYGARGGEQPNEQ